MLLSGVMILSFSDRRVQEFWETGKSKGMPPANLRRVALTKLFLLNAAQDLADLQAPPGNRLEELKGDRKGQYSIRINNQFRICFRWESGNAHDIEIVDYH